LYINELFVIVNELLSSRQKLILNGSANPN
jgi:hypothetical protein